MNTRTLNPPNTPSHWSRPRLSLRWWPVFQRNLLVWRKLAVPSLVGNIAEPLMWLVAFGYGLGALVGEVRVDVLTGKTLYNGEALGNPEIEALREACRRLRVVDAGVAHDFGGPREGLIDLKVASGTANIFAICAFCVGNLKLGSLAATPSGLV